MGLLSRVAASGAALDDMGKALRERLGKLPQKRSTPYTALSLLKAYTAFQAGACLSLKDGNYFSYTSVGFGIEKLSIPQEKIWPGEKAASRHFRLDPQQILATKNAKEDLTHWVFPLDVSASNTGQPWTAVMILAAHESSDFDPYLILAMLDKVADKMLLPAADEQAPAPGFDTPLEAEEKTEHQKLEEEIAQFHQTHLDFNCIVLENPAVKLSHDLTAQSAFCEKVSSVVDKAGTVIPLPSDRPLVLFPVVMDRELIAHRLSKTLDAVVLLSFQANNPENALTRIDSLM